MTVTDQIAVRPPPHRPAPPLRSAAREVVRAPASARVIAATVMGLGLAGTLFPRRTAAAVGAPVGRLPVVTLFGLREIATGLGLLNRATRRPVLWGRVAFDVFDIAVLALLTNRRNPRRKVAKLALVGVLAVTALDVAAARRRGPEAS